MRRFVVFSLVAAASTGPTVASVSLLPAQAAADSLRFPLGLATGQRIRRVDHATGVIRTIAGNRTEGSVGDGTPALEAPFKYFGAMIELDNGDLEFDEWAGVKLLRLDQREQRIRVLAGTGDNAAVDAEGSEPLKTRFGLLGGMVRDAQGRYYVVEPEPGRVTRIDLHRRRVETVVGPRRGSVPRQ